MKNRKMDLNRIQVNRPCASDWERMVGDDRMRFCGECDKQVYDLSSMTRREIESLVRSTNGRFCARVTRDADGSVITASPNVGLNLVKLRASRIASAVVTATLTLSQSVIAQPSSKPNAPSLIQSIQKTKDAINPNTSGHTGGIKGTVYDQQIAVIVGATVTVKNQKTDEEFRTTSSEEGVFTFTSLPLGSYDLVVDAQGFMRMKLENINLTNNVFLNIELQLSARTMGEIVFVDEVIKPTSIPERLLTPLKAIKTLIKKPKK